MRNLILLAVSLVFGFNVNAATVNRAPYATAGVSASTTSSGAAVTAYTAPANGYAIVQVNVQQSSSIICSVKVGTRYVSFPSATTIPYSIQGIYVGPSQAIQIENTSGTAVCTMLTSGVQFTNQ